MGYGGGSHDGGSLTDSIILAQVLPHFQKILLFSIPRDLWVNNNKINYAYPSGGGELSKQTVSQITGLPVDYYLAMDFSGFTKVIDQLGGIDLKITQPFSDPFYPLDIGATDLCGKTPEQILALESTMSGDKLDQQFTCRYEQLVFNVGTTHLDGATALKFARSRHSPVGGGDFNRGNRQRQVIMAIRDKVVSLNIFTKIIPIIKTLSYHLHTDISIATIEKYLLRASEFASYPVESYSFTDKNVLMITKSATGQSILVPTSGIDQFQDIQSFVASVSAQR
jgi:LCP family protein required for cell wall assembly